MKITLRLVLAALAICFLSLPASTLFAAEKAEVQDRTAASQTVTFDVYLPLQHHDQLEDLLNSLHNPDSPSYHKWLTPAEFNARFAATADTVSTIQQQLSSYGLNVAVLSPHQLHVTGPAASVEHALGTVLKNATYPSGKKTIVATQSLTPVSSLAQANAVVTGLSGMIRMRAHSQRLAQPSNRYTSGGPYWFDDLKQAYSYPSYQELNGKGVTIGILMAGDFNPADMDLYFGHEKLATPHYTSIPVNGGSPFDPNGSFETHLDLQQSGGMAPKADVVLYNLPDLSDTNIMAGLTQILNDNRADVVSMSFGGPEIFYTAAFNGGIDYTYILQQYDDLFAQGNAQGITFIASSGDSGGLAAVPLACFDPTATATCGSAIASVESPASSPHVTAVGGTNLVTTYTGIPGDLNSTYIREQAFADPLAGDIFYGTPATGSVWGSGGGDSIVYRKPHYQRYVHTGNEHFRTVPDVALHMGGCPNGAISCSPDDSADIDVIGGAAYGVIGTSASAPDFAGLTALTIQRFHSRLGNENYYIYALAASEQNRGDDREDDHSDRRRPSSLVFRTGIPGFNGVFSTTPRGYNRVLGNGTVNGVNFLLAPEIPVAGTPQTPSNP